MIKSVKPVKIERIFLDNNNPRHEAFETETEIIEYLMRDELVYQLARDIAANGLNPLEQFAIVPIEGKKNTYFVAEGNRRLCALKLLNDPDLAPARDKNAFEKLAQDWVGIKEVPAVIFSKREDVDLWLDRIHSGVAGGIGRKPWNTEQKTRHSGGGKNKLAQSILDFAEAKGMITPEQRKGKITTAQRYLGNALIKNAIGIDNSNPIGLSHNRPIEDFTLLIGKFIGDLKSGHVSSRKNKEDITTYSRELSSTKGLSGATTSSQLVEVDTKVPKRKKSKPKKPKTPKRIEHDSEVQRKIDILKNRKLESLYYSICNVTLEHNTPLVSVGLWAFIDSLTALIGRYSKTDFQTFLSAVKLEKMGLGDKRKTKSVREALGRICDYGNSTKHDDTSANFNGKQLNNDVASLKNLIVECLGEAISNKK